jgi:hypothetical protein
MAKHDPLAVLGICLLGAGGVFSLRVTLRMNRARRFGGLEMGFKLSIAARLLEGSKTRRMVGVAGLLDVDLFRARNDRTYRGRICASGPSDSD